MDLFATHRPLFWLAACFMAGIVEEGLFPFPLSLILGGMLVGAGISILCFRYRGLACACLFLAVFCAGALWLRNAQVLPSHHIGVVARERYGGLCTVRGVVASSPQINASAQLTRISFVLDARSLCRADSCRAVSGRVIVAMFIPPAFHAGDELVLRGRLHAPPEFFPRGRSSHREYLRRRGIDIMLSVKKKDVPLLTRRGSAWMGPALPQRARAVFSRVYSHYLSPGEAGLMNAFMLGERAGIPKHINDYFKRTGTAHVLPA